MLRRKENKKKFLLGFKQKREILDTRHILLTSFDAHEKVQKPFVTIVLDFFVAIARRKIVHERESMTTHHVFPRKKNAHKNSFSSALCDKETLFSVDVRL